MTDTERTHIRPVALSQVVGEVVLNLADELLGVLGVEPEDLTEALEADVLQVAVGQGLDVGVGLDHLLLRQGVRANQVTFTCACRKSHGHIQVFEAVDQSECVFTGCVRLRE